MGRAAEIGGQQAPRERLEPEEQDRPAKDHGRQDGHGQPVISPACRFFRLHSNAPHKAVFLNAFFPRSSSGFFGKKQQGRNNRNDGILE